MSSAELQVQMLVAWTVGQLRKRVRALREEPERGDGILVWVIMVALLAAAAITIVAIIVTKATSTANNVKTQ
jgi:hypothetical protein